MTGAEQARERKRRGHWLLLARKVSGVKQTDVAKRLGYKAGTSILAFEKGRRDPNASQQRLLAEVYGVPVSMFADPEPTDEERVIEARAALARAAIELAHEDLDQGEGPVPDGDAPPASPRRRRSA